MLAVAERHPEIDELDEPAGPRRRPAELGRDLDIGGPDQGRGGRAGLEARELEARLGGAREPVERDDCLDPIAVRGGGGEALGAEAAVGAAVRGKEDEGVLGVGRPATVPSRP